MPLASWLDMREVFGLGKRVLSKRDQTGSNGIKRAYKTLHLGAILTDLGECARSLSDIETDKCSPSSRAGRVGIGKKNLPQTLRHKKRNPQSHKPRKRTLTLPPLSRPSAARQTPRRAASAPRQAVQRPSPPIRCVVVDGNPSIEKIPRRNGRQTGRERRNLLIVSILPAFLQCQGSSRTPSLTLHPPCECRACSFQRTHARQAPWQ